MKNNKIKGQYWLRNDDECTEVWRDKKKNEWIYKIENKYNEKKIKTNVNRKFGTDKKQKKR